MTLIVAEVGSNFRDVSHVYQSIGQAKALGADVVKFQMFSSRDLYGYGTDTPRGIHAEWLPTMAEKARACGIELMCTAFSPEGMRVVDGYVSRHKVASSELCYIDLLQAVAKTGKPVIVSTGGHDQAEVELAARCLKDHGCPHVTVLYCVAEYPARRVDPMALLAPGMWAPKEADAWGFSDHTTDILGMPVLAAAQDADVIEKHVTFFPELDTPDRPHSLTPEEFDEMVRAIRRAREPFQIRALEKDMVLRHKRRLVAIKAIDEGEPFVYGENFGVCRSLVEDRVGLHPTRKAGLIGRVATRDIARGTPIGYMDISG